ASAPLASAAAGTGTDRALLVLQLRASRADQAALRPLPSLLFQFGRRHARLAAARLRLRRADLVLALPPGAVALARCRRAGAAPLLVRGADVLSRAPRLLRHPHLRHDRRRRGRLAARRWSVARLP